MVVVGAKGEPILDLQQKDFHILDDGVDQTIEAFDLGGEQVSAVFVFETSSRIAPLLPAIQKSAIVFTQTVVGPSGEAAVLSYDNSVNHFAAIQHGQRQNRKDDRQLEARQQRRSPL